MSDKVPMPADGGGRKSGDPTGAGRGGGGESGGGASGGTQGGDGGEAAGFMGHGGQSEINYHGPEQLGGSADPEPEGSPPNGVARKD